MSGPQEQGGPAGALLRAVRFAAEQHRDHRRKGAVDVPYINHPITVAEQLAAAGCQDDLPLLMAAVLHDVVEDTETTPEALEAAFGAEVAGIVLEVTDDKSLPWQRRKTLTVETIGHKSRRARLLKLSDLIANVHDVLHAPPDWDAGRKRRYLDWAEAVLTEAQGTHSGLEARLAALIADGRRALERSEAGEG